MRKLNLIVIGNCHVAAFIDRSGRCVWYCHPRLDADPVFNHLINGEDPEHGFMDVLLSNQKESRQQYVHNTAIAETLLTDQEGNSLRITDLAPRFQQFGRTFRPSMLIRRIEPVSGQCKIRVRIRPSFAYNSDIPKRTLGSNHISYKTESMALRVTTDMPVSFIEAESEFILEKPIHFIISDDTGISEQIDTICKEFTDKTTEYWHSWVRRLVVPFDWQEEVIRSAIALKLCNFEDSGAIVAALTTSIPESANSGRNWDYRYCWMRDAYFTVHALNRVGATQTMEDYIGYMANIINGAENLSLRPLYPIIPGTSLEENIAQNLKGFFDMGPVRIGNAAVVQRQNDVYGSVILAGAQMFWDCRLKAPGGDFLYNVLSRIGQQAYEDALIPDAGIWEYRGRTRVHTFSAAMCWAGVRQMGLIAEKLGKTEDSKEWMVKADDLKSQIMKRIVANGRNWIGGSIDGDEVDASVLLLPEIGFIKARDPFFLNTIEKIEKTLLRDGFIMRYVEKDDFGEPDVAFLICTFWYINALTAVGRRDEALDIFRKVLACRNHVGLLSEDIDTKDLALWGNFPQTYSQVGLIICALKLSQSWEQGLWRLEN